MLKPLASKFWLEATRPVGAWMNYPVDYEFGYTTFHEAEWKAGNRRSVCWARTTK